MKMIARLVTGSSRVVAEDLLRSKSDTRAVLRISPCGGSP
jgi:hypothetical protein